MLKKIYEQGTQTVTVAALDEIAVMSASPVKVYQLVGYPQIPDSRSLLATTVPGTVYRSGAFAAGATLELEASEAPAYYAMGTGPSVEILLQAAPTALNATGALTAAMMVGGIITSTTGAAVAGTVPDGTVLDAALDLEIGEAIDWTVINTGAANAFTVTAAAQHTVVGVAAVAALTSSRFRTRKSAAATFVTYRIAG